MVIFLIKRGTLRAISDCQERFVFEQSKLKERQ